MRDVPSKGNPTMSVTIDVAELESQLAAREKELEEAKQKLANMQQEAETKVRYWNEAAPALSKSVDRLEGAIMALKVALGSVAGATHEY